MSVEEDRGKEALMNIPEFIAHSDGTLKRNEDDRYRDFIIARQTGNEDEDPEDWYSFGEIDLPPESLDRLHTLVLNRSIAEIDKIRDQEKEFIKYGEGRADRDYIKYLTEDEFPLLGAFEEIFDERNLPDTQYFDGKDPSFQAIRILNQDNDMVIGFQYYWGNQLLGNTSLFNLYWKDGDHEPMDEPIISIPKRLDAIYHDGYLFILNDWQFEQMFDYRIYYEGVAEEVLEAIDDSSVEFADQSMVESAIESNPIMMRKLEEVKETGLYEELGMDDIDWVIQEYELEGIDVKTENGQSFVTIENKLRVWQLIHILNDDHVESRLTERAYQTGDKTEL